MAASLWVPLERPDVESGVTGTSVSLGPVLVEWVGAESSSLGATQEIPAPLNDRSHPFSALPSGRAAESLRESTPHSCSTDTRVKRGGVRASTRIHLDASIGAIRPVCMNPEIRPGSIAPGREAWRLIDSQVQSHPVSIIKSQSTLHNVASPCRSRSCTSPQPYEDNHHHDSRGVKSMERKWRSRLLSQIPSEDCGEQQPSIQLRDESKDWEEAITIIVPPELCEEKTIILEGPKADQGIEMETHVILRSTNCNLPAAAVQKEHGQSDAMADSHIGGLPPAAEASDTTFGAGTFDAFGASTYSTQGMQKISQLPLPRMSLSGPGPGVASQNQACGLLGNCHSEGLWSSAQAPEQSARSRDDATLKRHTCTFSSDLQCHPRMLGSQSAEATRGSGLSGHRSLSMPLHKAQGFDPNCQIPPTSRHPTIPMAAERSNTIANLHCDIKHPWLPLHVNRRRDIADPGCNSSRFRAQQAKFIGLNSEKSSSSSTLPSARPLHANDQSHKNLGQLHEEPLCISCPPPPCQIHKGLEQFIASSFPSQHLGFQLPLGQESMGYQRWRSPSQNIEPNLLPVATRRLQQLVPSGIGTHTGTDKQAQETLFEGGMRRSESCPLWGGGFTKVPTFGRLNTSPDQEQGFPDFRVAQATDTNSPFQHRVCGDPTLEASKPMALRCPRGHVMAAEVAKEMVSRFTFLHRRSRCNQCGRQLTNEDAHYTCSPCAYSVCTSCSARMFPLPHTFDGATGMDVCNIMAGDILLYGPDQWGIHHAVLARGQMRIDDNAARVLGLGSDQAIYSCLTIESSQEIKGRHIPWYAGRSFYARDTLSGAAKHVGDLEDGSSAIEKHSRQWPVKVLLHPLRLGHGGPTFNSSAFSEAVQRCALVSKDWDLNTAISGFFSRQECLDAADYPDTRSRKSLLRELHKRWARPPICTSVVIMVWQMYFEIACRMAGEDDDSAAQHILQWMPVLSDQTMPSVLLQVLTRCGWVLRGNLDT